MTSNLFWDKYDRLTTSKSFFHVNYKDFMPEISSKDYDYIISTKLSEELLDRFPNQIKLFLIRNFELILGAYSAEMCLCSHKKLIQFMENVLEFIKLERLYLAHLNYPLRNGISAGDNELSNSLLRFKCLLEDFRLLYKFKGYENRDDFINAKDLINQFSTYFRAGLIELKEYATVLPYQQHNLYTKESRIINDLLSTSDEIDELITDNCSGDDDSAALDNSSDSNESDVLSTYSLLGEDEVQDIKSHLKLAMNATVKKYDSLTYSRLPHETQYDTRLAAFSTADTSMMNSVSMVSPNKSFAGPNKSFAGPNKSFAISEASTVPDQVFRSFHKYDKLIGPVSESATLPKGSQLTKSKESHSASENVSSIMSKSFFNRISQEVGVLSGFQDTAVKAVMDQTAGQKMREYPLAKVAKTAALSHDGELNTEMLKLVNVEFDPNSRGAHWSKFSVVPSQQGKFKDLSGKLEEQIKKNTDTRLWHTEEEKPQDDEAAQDSDFGDSEDDEVENFNIREKRVFLERRRRGVNITDDPEFQPISNNLNEETAIETRINDYVFYEKTLLAYEKPEKDYLAQTENILERPTYSIPDQVEDYAYREPSPRSSRKGFLKACYGGRTVETLEKNAFQTCMNFDVTSIANNKKLREEMMKDLQRNLKVQHLRARQKYTFSKESVIFMKQSFEEQGRPSDSRLCRKRERRKHLWSLLRDYVSARVFYKKLMRKSARKELEVLGKLKGTVLIQYFLASQSECFIHKTYTNYKNKEVEFIAMNRLWQYQSRYDYVRNYDKILKPSQGLAGMDPNMMT